MAEVKIELNADPRGALAGIKRFGKGASSAFDRLRQRGTSAFTKLEAASTRAFVRIRKEMRGMKGELKQGFGSLIPLASVAGFVAGARKLIITAGQIEEGWIGVAKTTGMVGQELEELKQEIRDMSVEMKGIKLEEFQNIATIAGQLGIKGVENISEFTRVISMIGVATNLTAEVAATDFAQIANIMKEPTANLEKMGSVMNELSNNTVATASDISDLTKRMGGAGKVLGLTTPEIMAIAASIKDMGVEVEVGGTAMSQLFQRMISDTEGFASAAGIPLKRYSRLVKDKPVEALRALLQNLSEMDKFKGIEAIKNLGLDGVRVVGTLLKLSGGIDVFNKNMRLANDEMKRGTSLQVEYGTASKGLFAQSTSVSNAFKLLAEETGKTLLPAIKTLLPWVTKSVQSFVNFGKLIGDTAGFIREADFSTPRDLIRENDAQIKILTASINALGKANRDGNYTDILLSEVEQLKVLIPLQLRLEKIKAGGVNPKKGDSKAKAGDSKTGGVDPAAKAAAKAADEVKAAFAALGTGTEAAMVNMAQKALEQFTTIKESGVATPWEIAQAYGAASEKINSVLDAMGGKQSDVASASETAWNDLLDGIGNGTKSIDDYIAFLTTTATPATETFANKSGAVKDILKTLDETNAAPTITPPDMTDALFAAKELPATVEKPMTPVLDPLDTTDAMAKINALRARAETPIIIPIKGEGSKVLPISEKIDDIKTMFGSLENVRPTVTADFSQVSNGIDSVADRINNLSNFTQIPAIQSFLSGRAAQGFRNTPEELAQIMRRFVPSFDTGTPYVKKDTLAFVHKGERITPAAENRGGATIGAITINVQSTDPRAAAREIRAELRRLESRL